MFCLLVKRVPQSARKRLHKSVLTMNEKPKVMIVGSGLVGNNVAYYLSKYNKYNILVVDSESELRLQF